MMKQILPLIIVLIAVGGAGFGAFTLRGGNAPVLPNAEGEEHAEEEGDAHGEKHGSVKKVHGDGHDEASGPGYFKFKRDFIVPVMRGDRVDSLVLMRVSIEMDPDRIENFRPKEPRIRDSFMRSLLSLSHDGYFKGDITSPDVYNEVQSRLLVTAKDIMNDEPTDILIVDFARQDQ